MSACSLNRGWLLKQNGLLRLLQHTEVEEARKEGWKLSPDMGKNSLCVKFQDIFICPVSVFLSLFFLIAHSKYSCLCLSSRESQVSDFWAVYLPMSSSIQNCNSSWQALLVSSHMLPFASFLLILLYSRSSGFRQRGACGVPWDRGGWRRCPSPCAVLQQCLALPACACTCTGGSSEPAGVLLCLVDPPTKISSHHFVLDLNLLLPIRLWRFQ